MAPSEWTLETLKARFDQMLLDHAHLDDFRYETSEATLKAMHAALKEAVLKAEAATEKRLEGLNELRAAWTDNQRTLYPRAEAELAIKNLETRLDAISKAQDMRVGEKSGLHVGWSIALAVFGLLSLVVGLLFALKK